jgi:hypothetical protein
MSEVFIVASSETTSASSCLRRQATWIHFRVGMKLLLMEPEPRMARPRAEDPRVCRVRRMDREETARSPPIPASGPCDHTRMFADSRRAGLDPRYCIKAVLLAQGLSMV